MTPPALPPPSPMPMLYSTQHTLGPKTRQTVVVVLKTTNSAMMRNAESGLSPTSSVTGTPAAHVMTTL